MFYITATICNTNINTILFSAVARLQRNINDPPQQFMQEQPGILQVTTSQELSSPAFLSRDLNQKLTGIKPPSLTHNANTIGSHPVTHSLEMSASSPTIELLNPNKTLTNNDIMQTTKPQLVTGANVQGFQPRATPNDPYAQQPPTPRPAFTPRPGLSGFTQPSVRPGENPEISQHLRDLLQSQHQFKKLDDQLLPGKGQQRVWPPSDTPQEQEQTMGTIVSGDATFRHPLPPGIRPRSLQPGGIVRQALAVPGLRMAGDPRLQNLDPRMRLLLQQVK